eukprot:8552932-Pyramimonas_sp.AAC.2
MSMTGGYVFFALGFLLLQSASTTLALSSPNGRAFPSRSLLETQNCTNLCESGETHESDSRGRVSSSCTCTQVIDQLQSNLLSTIFARQVEGSG